MPTDDARTGDWKRVVNMGNAGDWSGGTPTEMPRAPGLDPGVRPPPGPQTPIPVTLTRAEWEVVLAVLNEAPVANRIVAPLLVAITRQLQVR